MDNATNDLLRDIAALQKEQNELLKRYLWRLRFSLLTLLLITTATAVMLGIYETKRTTVAPTPAVPMFSGPVLPAIPTVPPTPTPRPLSPRELPKSSSNDVTIMPLRQ